MERDFYGNTSTWKHFITGVLSTLSILVALSITIAYIATAAQFNGESFHPPPVDTIKSTVTTVSILLSIGVFVLVSFPLVFCYVLSKKSDLCLRLIACVVALFLLFLIISHVLTQNHFQTPGNLYHKGFMDEMNYSKNNQNYKFSPWLNKVQEEFQCCGYDNSEDYLQYQSKIPSSCCDDSKNSHEMQTKCKNPSPTSGANSTIFNEHFYYFPEGCACSLISAIREYRWTFLVITVIGIILMTISLILTVAFVIFVRKTIPSTYL